jgi:hypothetical protein
MRRIIYPGILMGALIFPACDNPFDQGTASQGTASEPAIEEGDFRLGRVWIRFNAAGKKQRNLYPEFGSFSRYVLSFTHEGGETLPDAVIEDEDYLSVDLKTGIWNITARAFAAAEGGLLAAAAQGGVEIAVEAGAEIHAFITLDTIIPGEGIAGFFSYRVEFPRELVSSAVMELSLLGAGETYIPYTVLDLTEEGKGEASLSLPAGYYRMDIRLGTIFPVIRGTEIIHIYPSI